MSLYTRLMGIGVTQAAPKLPGHQVHAMMAEFARGKVTGAQAAVAFGLTASEQQDALNLKNRVLDLVNPLTREEINDVFMLMDLRIPPYDNEAAVKTRFGVP